MSDLNVTIPITSLDIFITYKFGNEDLGTDMLDRCLYLISDRMDELQSIVKDKQTFNIKKKALDRLENVNLELELEFLQIEQKKAGSLLTKTRTIKRIKIIFSNLLGSRRIILHE